MRMDQNEKIILALLLTCIILGATLAAVAATYPKPQDKGVIIYEGWSIYQPDVNGTRTSYVATKPGWQPLTNSDLSDLLADINEANK